MQSIVIFNDFYENLSICLNYKLHGASIHENDEIRWKMILRGVIYCGISAQVVVVS